MAEVQVAVRRYFSTDEWTEGPLQLAARAITTGSRKLTFQPCDNSLGTTTPPSPSKTPLMTECVPWCSEGEENRRPQAWSLGLGLWKNSSCCPPPSRSCTGSKSKPSAEIPPPMPPNMFMPWHKISNTSAGQESTRHGRGYFSSPLAQWCLECVQASVSWEGVGAEGWIEFFDEKRGKEWV